jgi:electron transport complex protein RnfE
MTTQAKNLVSENPVFIVLIGLCPALAITGRLIDALCVGAAVLIVMAGSQLTISVLRKFIPEKMRVPAVLLVVCALVTVIDLLLNAFLPSLSARLGIFLPLVAVNCLILSRAGSFAFQNNSGVSLLDALGKGAGFFLALALIALIREIIGSGTISFSPLAEGGAIVIPLLSTVPVAVVAAPAGAFLIIGLLMGLFNSLPAIKKRISGRLPPPSKADQGTQANDEGQGGQA